MKSFKTHLAVAIFLGALTQVGANEAVDAQIQAIKDADPQERRELINELKQEIAQMNKDEQSEAVIQMRLQLKAMNQEKVMTAEKTQTKKQVQYQYKEKQESESQEQKRIQTMKQTQKMQQTQQMQQMENMNQHQGANQFSQEMMQSNTANQTFGQKGQQ